ncbi:MAG: HEAT repeat domain-containing protein [Fimbriimonadales bacterium]
MIVVFAACLLSSAILAGQSVTIPRDAEERLIRDLLGQSAGGSYFDVKSSYDIACERLEAIGRPAVPFLIDTLSLTDRMAKVRAIEVLARIKDRRAFAPILNVLATDPDQRVKEQAAYNLGDFGDLGAIPLLLDAAVSKDPATRRAAWHSLGHLREPRAVPILARNLDFKFKTRGFPPSLDDTPTNALVEIGEPAVGALISVLRASTAEARLQAGKALGRIGTREAIAALQAAMADPEAKEAAIAGLLATHRPQDLPLAINALRNRSLYWSALGYLDSLADRRRLPDIKAAIVAAERQNKTDSDRLAFGVLVSVIRRLKDRSSIPLLIHLIETGREEDESVQAIGEFGDARAIPALLKVVERWTPDDDSFGLPPTKACWAIANLGPKAIEALEREVERKPKYTLAVAAALGACRNQAAAPRLMQMLSSHPTQDIRFGLFFALGRMRYVKAANLIAEDLNSSSKAIRATAVSALALMGDARAIGPLTQLTEERDVNFFTSEWKALGMKGIPALGKLLAANRYAAASALFVIRCPESTDLLIRGLQSKNPKVAALCAEGLGERRAARAAIALLTALARPEVDVRNEAYRALRALGGSVTDSGR